MTDFEQLIRTFEILKIAFKISNVDPSDKRKVKIDACISIDEGEGYYGFYCDFYFYNGRFISHSVLE